MREAVFENQCDDAFFSLGEGRQREDRHRSNRGQHGIGKIGGPFAAEMGSDGMDHGIGGRRIGSIEKERMLLRAAAPDQDDAGADRTDCLAQHRMMRTLVIDRVESRSREDDGPNLPCCQDFAQCAGRER